MDPVATALIAALSSGLKAVADEAVSDAYKSIKSAIQRKLGITKAIDELESQPDSKQRQARLTEELAIKNAIADPELIALAQRLQDAIKETQAGRKSSGKYNIHAAGAQIGVLGDGARIEGGLHIHQHHGSRTSIAESAPSSKESISQPSNQQGDPFKVFCNFRTFILERKRMPNFGKAN